jgi:hypothetical protein
LGLIVWGLRFRVCGSGFRVTSPAPRAVFAGSASLETPGPASKVWCERFGVLGLGFRV